jgi:hypothetical protein
MTTMTTKRLLLSLSAAALASTGAVLAFNPQPEPPAFGMVGIAFGQTALLNAVNAQPPDPGIPPDPDQPPDPGQPPDPQHPACRMVLSFVDGTGQVLTDASGQKVSKLVELGPGMADSLRLRASQILGRDEMRRSIRALLTHAPEAGQPPDPTLPPDPMAPPSPCSRLIATLEILSPLGVTQLLYAGQPPDPQAPQTLAR